MTATAYSKSRVEIGIPTRNRWDDLRKTLAQLAELGLGEFRILIYDDASETACPYDVRTICAGAELHRFAEPQGCIALRNRMAAAMRATYCLSLDDDSFPVSAALDEAVAFAESCSRLFALSFPVYNPVAGEFQIESHGDAPYPVRAFGGGANLMNRRAFLDLGGYQEVFTSHCEESDIAIRAFGRGWHCYHFPGLQFHHTQSPAGRNLHRIDYYVARNSTLWYDWYVPSRLNLWQQSRAMAGCLRQAMSARPMSKIRGKVDGLKQIARLRAHRQRLPLELYRRWLALPPC